MNTRITIIVILAIAVLAAGLWFVMSRATVPAEETPVVLSFEDCLAAGYPVMESYPRQCRTPDGRTYAEELSAEQRELQITYVNATKDQIVVTNPTPGAVTGKEFTVTGQARGGWYFEASFPIELRGKDGAILDSGIATAQGEWMTNEFVPFTATLAAPASYIGEATLVLHRDNPSGMPENDASISIPFTIEY